MQEKYLLISGRPGVGKTEMLMSYANLYPKETIILSEGHSKKHMQERGLHVGVDVVSTQELGGINYLKYKTFCIDYIELFDRDFIMNLVEELMLLDIRIVALSHMRAKTFYTNNIFEQVLNKQKCQNVLEFAKLKIKLPFEMEEKMEHIVCSNHGNIVYISQHKDDKAFEKNICQYLSEDLKMFEKKDLLLHFSENENSLYNTNIDELLLAGLETDYPSIELFSNNKKLNLPDISLVTYMKYPIFYNEDTTIVVEGDLAYFDANRIDKVFDLRAIAQAEEEQNEQ